MKTIVMLLACALPLIAQGNTKADSAKAEAIVARHTAAMGGAPAFRALKQAHIVMTSSIRGSPAIHTEVYTRAPNLVYMKTNLPGLGPMEMGYDGKSAWSISRETGPVVHDKPPQNLLNAGNIMGVPLDGAKVTYAGRRKIGWRQYDVVRAFLPDSERMTGYFDVKTGLLAGMDRENEPPPPPGRMTISFANYKYFGAVMQATKVTVLASDGQEMVTRTVRLRHAGFVARIFAPPPAVQHLLNKPSQR